MSTVIMPTQRQAIISSEDSIIEYIKQFNKSKLFLFSGAYVGSKIANYLLTLKPKDEIIDEKVVQYWMDVLRTSKMFYKGGHSTIHFDQEGKLMDWYERLSAIARSGIVNRRDMPMVNLHFGILPFIANDMRMAEYPKAPTSVYTAPPIEFIEVETPVVKEPEYVAKYSGKAISLIMAMQVGDMTIKYNRKQTSTWEKDNDNALLEKCVNGSQCESLSKVSTRFLTASEWGALMYITSVISEDESSTFFTLIQSEVTLTHTHAITKLRTQFGMSPNYVSRDNIYRMGLVIRAWNAFRAGNAEVGLQYDPTKEEFPKAK